MEDTEFMALIIYNSIENQIRSDIISQLQSDIINGLTDGMSMKNLAKFREYIESMKGCV